MIEFSVFLKSSLSCCSRNGFNSLKYDIVKKKEKKKMEVGIDIITGVRTLFFFFFLNKYGCIISRTTALASKILITILVCR